MSLIAGNLGIMQRLLDEHSVVWGIHGGAAAHVYGNRRPIKNIDILVASGMLRSVVEYMQQAKRVVQFDGRRVMWSGINLTDDLSVRRLGITHAFKMDDLMMGHVRRVPLLGSRVAMLAPEDVLVHKVLLERDGEAGVKDHGDASSVAQRQTMDIDYLKQRLQACGAPDRVRIKIEELGVSLTTQAE